MFKQRSLVALMAGLAAACSLAGASPTPPPPANTVSVPSLSTVDAPAHGFARLRIHLTGPVAEGEPVSLTSVAACSASTCFEAMLRRQVTVRTTADGRGTHVADLEVPFGEIASIRFRARDARGALDGSVALAAPFHLPPGYAGADVLVVIGRRGASLRPVAATANFLSHDGLSVYYDPAFATQVELPYQMTLAIPAAAIASPQIFLVRVYKTGDEGPFIDVRPDLKLLRPATIELRSPNPLAKRKDAIVIKTLVTGFVDPQRSAPRRATR